MMNQRQYRSGTLEKGLDVLETLERAQDPLRIQDVASTTGLERVAVFRLLCTLEDRGYIERLPDKRYRAKRRRRLSSVYYIAPLTGNSFRLEVTAGIQRAAEGSGLELHLIDSSDTGLPQSQIEQVIEAGADVVILFQRRGSLAHVFADRFFEAQIPVISVETPIAGAIYFGGNSYRAGVLAGEALARFAKKYWNSSYDHLALLESSLSATENMARLTGAVEGVAKVLGAVPNEKILHVDGLASREGSRSACRKMLAALPKQDSVLISCFNDVSALGALEAVQEAGREKFVAIVGQNGTEESRKELQRRSSALIASVGYFPEQYGSRLMKLAVDIVTHQKTPLAIYTDHVLLHRGNLRKYYSA
ncbi:MAG TPA: substrate-binding domain-containing protein [Edaphobacter sp.]|jgi:ribose transport system substrate-binding protein|nr:substrate-binding domain-containing protein [Edaphobacter sp.]